MFSVRRWAVTVISAMLSVDALVLASVLSAVGAAADAPKDVLPKIAATAYLIFEFIASSLQTFWAPRCAGMRAGSPPARLCIGVAGRGAIQFRRAPLVTTQVMTDLPRDSIHVVDFSAQ